MNGNGGLDNKLSLFICSIELDDMFGGGEIGIGSIELQERGIIPLGLLIVL